MSNGFRLEVGQLVLDAVPSDRTRARMFGRTDSRAFSMAGGSPTMRKLLTALAIMVATLAVFEGCAPVPLPHYAAYKPKRVEELLVDSENLRQAGDDWERAWLLDQPSHMTPFRTHGGLGP
jgi:hypothetical protein